MRIVSGHNCDRHHRNAQAVAACVWPNHTSISGKGFLAVVTSCRDVTVVCFERIAPARLHLRELEVFGCSRECVREHELLALDIDATTEAAA